MATSTPLYTIRKLDTLTEKQTKEADALMDAAFANDDFAKVMTGGDRAMYGPFCRSAMVAGLYGGEVYVAEVDDVIIGAAVWYGPGRALYDSPEQLEKGWSICTAGFRAEVTEWWMTKFLPMYAQFGDATFGAGHKVASWHLQMFAVDPKFQRKGIGRALIDIIKEKATLEGIPLVLECATETNVGIYQKYGFEVKGETWIEGLSSGVKMWGMYQATAKAPAVAA